MPVYWEADSYRFGLMKGRFNLVDDTVKLALVDDSMSSSYSAWSSSSPVLGDIVIPTTRNGHRYRCSVAGTTDSSEPTWPLTTGATVTDGTATWEEYGGDLCNKIAWADISASEVATGDGYTTGGATLVNMAVSQNEPRIIEWDADDVTFTALTKTFKFGFIYKSGTIDGVVNPLIGYVLYDDAFENKVIAGIDFLTQWSNFGISTLRHPSA